MLIIFLGYVGWDGRKQISNHQEVRRVFNLSSYPLLSKIKSFYVLLVGLMLKMGLFSDDNC